MSQSIPTLAIFAKQPVAGQVKTRLCPPLTALQARDLYQVCLAETVQRMRACRLRIVLCHAGSADWFRVRFPDTELLAQSDGDLGTRLNAAADTLLATGAGPLLLIGSDSPDLPLQYLDQALELLRDHDLAIVPAHDGGYVLLGLRAACPAVFSGIPWSTPQVLAATRRQAAGCGLSLAQLTPWDDLDDLAALHRLVQRAPQSRTARHILHHLSHLLPV